MSKQKLQEIRADELSPGLVLRVAAGYRTVARIGSEGGMVAVTYVNSHVPVLYAPDQRVEVYGRPYRIEERYIGADGDEPVMSVSSWDRQPLNRESGWKLLEFSRRQYPNRYRSVDGRPALYRLVLVGPSHTIAPGGVR